MPFERRRRPPRQLLLDRMRELHGGMVGEPRAQCGDTPSAAIAFLARHVARHPGGDTDDARA
ncbi:MULTISPECIES: hypothetical protein [unclassified Burkholderia]|uniref:hypothetical protein n=1 Tax=unclassified Burkholderia TaxID=2613784 RepID=UPI0015C5D250|nr:MULTISPECIES: hypothetical protein [unclassified Burkholderia]